MVMGRLPVARSRGGGNSGSAGELRLDGRGRLWWKPHGEAEVAEAPAWDRRGFAGDRVHALRRHVVDHLPRGGPPVNGGGRGPDGQARP